MPPNYWLWNILQLHPASSDWNFTPFEKPNSKLTLERSSLLRPDVHIKYASHAHLDLLFDIYCRRIQAWWGGIAVKMGDGWCPWKGNVTSMTWPFKQKGLYLVPRNPWFPMSASDISLFPCIIVIPSWLVFMLQLTKGQESNLAHLWIGFKLWNEHELMFFWSLAAWQLKKKSMDS